MGVSLPAAGAQFLARGNAPAAQARLLALTRHDRALQALIKQAGTPSYLEIQDDHHLRLIYLAPTWVAQATRGWDQPDSQLSIRFDLPEGMAWRLAALEQQPSSQRFPAPGQPPDPRPIRQAVHEDGEAAAQSPGDPVLRERYALSLLRAGFGEAARQEARLATRLEPARAQAWRTLGIVLGHNAFGVYLAPGMDRSGAAEAFDKARELGTEDLEVGLLRVALLGGNGQSAGLAPAEAAPRRDAWRALSRLPGGSGDPRVLRGLVAIGDVEGLELALNTAPPGFVTSLLREVAQAGRRALAPPPAEGPKSKTPGGLRAERETWLLQRLAAQLWRDEYPTQGAEVASAPAQVASPPSAQSESVPAAGETGSVPSLTGAEKALTGQEKSRTEPPQDGTRPGQPSLPLEDPHQVLERTEGLQRDQLEPKAWEAAQVQRCEALDRLGLWADLLLTAEGVLQENPKSEEGLRWKLVALGRLGRTVEGFKLAEQALRQGALTGQALESLATLLDSREALAQAAPLLAALEPLERLPARLHTSLAFFRLSQGGSVWPAVFHMQKWARSLSEAALPSDRRGADNTLSVNGISPKDLDPDGRLVQAQTLLELGQLEQVLPTLLLAPQAERGESDDQHVRYILGRLAEAYGILPVARQYYRGLETARAGSRFDVRPLAAARLKNLMTPVGLAGPKAAVAPTQPQADASQPPISETETPLDRALEGLAPFPAGPPIPAVSTPIGPRNASPGPVLETRPSAPPVLSQARLANGLQVLVVTDPLQPRLATQLWVKAGQIHSPADCTAAHLLEHLLFGGPSGQLQGDLDRLMSREGGTSQAFTLPDQTVFSLESPPELLPQLLASSLERLRHPRLDEASVARERRIMAEEQAEKQTAELGSEAFRQAIHQVLAGHPYQCTVRAGDQGRAGNSRAGASAVSGAGESTGAGTPDEGVADAGTPGEGLSLEGLRRFYQRYYQPGNLTLVVVGPLPAAQVMEEANRSLGKLTPGREPVPVIPALIDWPLEPRVTVKQGRQKRASAMLIYPLPPIEHPDYGALHILQQLLLNEISDPLSEELTRRYGRSLVGETAVIGFARGGLLIFSLNQLAFHSRATAFRRLRHGMESLHQLEWLTEDRVQAARLGLSTQDWKRRFDPAQLAGALGQWSAFIPAEQLQLDQGARYAQVSRADVARVYEKYVRDAAGREVYLEPATVSWMLRLYGPLAERKLR